MSSFTSALCTRLERFEELTHIERARLLAGWKLLEALEELSGDCLRGNESPELVGPPTFIGPRLFVIALKWVLP